jgi:hypothetical protein
MTLIVTHISRHGIVHASDSNLTSLDDKDVGEAKKIFEIDFLNAGLTIAGIYGVGKIPMDVWMPNFIQQQSKIPKLDLRTFSNNLKDALQSIMTKKQKLIGSIIHIAGYVEENGTSHPEFWFIRNIHKIDLQTGEYKDIDENFEISEDFWTRDYKNESLKDVFQNPRSFTHQIYVNGFPPGRIGFNVIKKELDRFYQGIWNFPEWKFREPKTIQETELLVRNYMQVINTLFVLSDYQAKYIGGPTQTYLIKQPENIVDKKL